MPPGPGTGQTPVLQPTAAPPDPRVRTPTPIAGVPVGPTCPSCQTVNPLGMNFCKMCGAPLKQGSGPVAPAPLPAAMAATMLPAGMMPQGQMPHGPTGSGGIPGGLPPPASLTGARSSMPAARPVTGSPQAFPGTPPQQPAQPAPMAALVAPMAMPGSGSASAMRVCPSCQRETPAGFSFCQHCGARQQPPAATPASAPMPAAAAPRPSTGAPAAPPPAIDPIQTLRDPHGPVVGPADEAVLATLAVTPVPGAPLPGGGEAFAATIAPSQAALAAAQARPQSAPGGPGAFGATPMATPAAPVGAGTLQSAGASPMPAPRSQQMARPQPAYGRLISVHRDGSDGQTFPLQSEHVAVGRTDGELTFGDDRYLAPRHAQLERHGKGVLLRVLDTVNGVYVRITEPTPLHDGDQFLLGKQVLKLELVDVPEREPAQALQHGVMIFGSPSRAVWGRLRQMLISGGTRDVLHLGRADMVLGREEGDFRFPDDEFMSRRHAQITWREGRATLVDLASSNGSYLRLRGERELKNGDLLRMGDQLFRFELA